MQRLLAVAFVSVLIAPVTAIAQPDEVILGHMIEAYATVQSYSDSGVVLIHLPQLDSPSETTFETVFARPNLFRFTWVARHPYPPLSHQELRSVIWSDGTRAFERYGRAYATEPLPGKTQTSKSLRLAIAGATGVSGGSAHTVPRLLMPEIGGFSLGELQSPSIVGTEDIDGTNCYHIRGNHPLGPIDVWLGSSDYLIRKVQERLSGILSEERRRNIRINETIPAAKFLP